MSIKILLRNESILHQLRQVVWWHKIKFHYITVNILSRITVEGFRTIPINLDTKIRPWLLSPSSDIYREPRCHTPSIKVPCVPVSSNDCGIAPINSGRLHNIPLYKRRTKILSHPPSNRVTPVFGTQIFHVDTFDINSIRQGLVPIHGSAVFIRVTRRARFSLPYTVTGQLFTRVPLPASRGHYVRTACVSLPLCDVLFGQISFPNVHREFSTVTRTFHRPAGVSFWSFRHRLRHLRILFFTRDTNIATLGDFCFEIKKRSLWKCHRALWRPYIA